MNNYNVWVNDLYDMMKNDTFFNTYNIKLSIHNSEKENSGLAVHDYNLSKTLIIDSTSIKPFYNQIGEPRLSYQQSLGLARGECMKTIKNWSGMD